jgi:hypothetical protein
MPSEERFITFDLEEIYDAIRIKCLADKMERPIRGELLKIEMSEEQDLISLNVKREDNGEEEQLSFERKFFAEALVFFCQGYGIPLPRRGQKLLQIASDKITMKVETIVKAPAKDAAA